MKYVIVLSALMLGVASCSPLARGKASFYSLDAEAFERYIVRDDVVLVDVRTAEEYAAGHLHGVDYQLDVRSANFFQEYQQLPKDKRIALYCRGGGRSKQVAGVLAGNGYHVVELSGGYNAWVEADKAVEK